MLRAHIKTVEVICGYFRDAGTIAKYHADLSKEFDYNTLPEEYVQSLFGFAAAHVECEDTSFENCHLFPDPLLEEQATFELVVDGFKHFVGKHGASLYHAHIQRYIDACGSVILNSRVSLNLASETILEQSSPSSLFEMLFNTSDRVALVGTLGTYQLGEAGKTFEDCRNDWAHNQALARFSTLVRTVQLKSITLDGLTTASDQKSKMNSADAEVMLDMICAVRDAALVGALTHNDLMLKIDNDKTHWDESHLFDKLPREVQFLKEALARLDDKLTNQSLLLLEKKQCI